MINSGDVLYDNVSHLLDSEWGIHVHTVSSSAIPSKKGWVCSCGALVKNGDFDHVVTSWRHYSEVYDSKLNNFIKY